MNTCPRKQLSTEQLEACAFYGVDNYPELGVLGAMLLGINQPPKKPEAHKRLSYLDYTPDCCAGDSSVDDLFFSFKNSILNCLSENNRDPSEVLSCWLDVEEEMFVISTLDEPDSSEIISYQLDLDIYNKMLSILPKVEEKVKELCMVSDSEEQRKIAIRKQIAVLEAQL